MHTNEFPAHLYVHEWLAVVLVISLALAITFITHFSNSGPLPTALNPPHHIVAQKVEVFIEGAVDRPGRYVVAKGARVEEVLKEVQLLPEADISKIKLNSKVRRGQHIRIPCQKARKR
ncbi:MAG: hypothetical protein LLG04_11155 [Parachlamydia sp.]|nr:hypothetical protein [Parachlamydia sp.]